MASTLRRIHDPGFMQHYFHGVGLDLGADATGLARCSREFPRVVRVVPWKGELMAVPGVEHRSFDFVHASHCLQTVVNPAKALGRWLDLLKTGGYLVLTVPDQDLADQTVQPAETNDAPARGFSVCKDPLPPGSVNLLELVRAYGSIAACERIAVIRPEQAIEVVLRKRPAPTPAEMLGAAGRARNVEDFLQISQTTLRLFPYRFDVAHQVSVGMMRWNLFDEAETLWARMVTRLPEEWGPKLYQFLHVISSGKINEGFRLRAAATDDWSWKRRTSAPPPETFPRWTGQSLAGKTIAIWSEFGLGDEIFFLRFSRMLRKQAGARSVTVVCQSPLVELFEASGEADAVLDIRASAAIPEHDYWVYPHDIPAWLPVELDALPASVPYLRLPSGAPPVTLPGRPQALKVGVAFKGAPTHENDGARSLRSLSMLDSLFAHEEVEFFSLQKGRGADEAADYARKRSNFHDIGATLETMMDTARVIAALDLVLTVDTSVAHVAGAMGKPTWLLVPEFADWRWHYVREDSPWYPTMKLFRHPPNGSWAEVLTRVNGHLLERVAAHAAPPTLE
ncbi:methyltransferase domain-containing protein [Cupriavidus agavae]|uniref:Methyltransferase family protein n=1 Tax=Cupriavidus agavae TaxID=1001822 RepID=A0A4Q7R7N9_9BURK|nr:methyltransferase domain-containing protein [Cupriavidus agavae]RZT28823.1 methyltransferase family protein [Cupriavidus agavae]